LAAEAPPKTAGREYPASFAQVDSEILQQAVQQLVAKVRLLVPSR